MSGLVSVVVQTPAHSAISGALTYRSELPLAPGTLVRVPLGNRETLGIVWDCTAEPHRPLEPAGLRPISGAFDGLTPLDARWRKLIQFSADYYQRSVGEIALAALPPQLRELSLLQVTRRLTRVHALNHHTEVPEPHWPVLSPEQQEVLQKFLQTESPCLLFGSTGSGKTEVYLRAVRDVLARDPEAQVLVMVPEINLTPQLEARVRRRFEAQWGATSVVTLHSGLTPAQRLKNWLSAHQGHARIVLGTRIAVFASLPRLQLVIVDEEHDPSYKSQDGARFSARDLAIYRASLTHNTQDPQGACQVLLGSATPSLESWFHSRSDLVGARYKRLEMPSRIGAAGLPTVRLVDMKLQPSKTVLSTPLLQAIAQRIARGEQSLIFLNQRGYAPVLHCASCDWKSDCPNCSAYRVFHKIDRTLRCHHCGLTQRVPRACPQCGDMDIAALGRGTEQLEEQVSELFNGLKRPDGGPTRVLRVDADSTRGKGALDAHLASVHCGEVDILVGTQMIAKGHDFRYITLVAAINPDGALYSSDFRAPERLFSLLMQAAGRAGRDAIHSENSEMWIQTYHPQHPIYAALRNHDFSAFADQQLVERSQAGMPPFSFQALVRAEARDQACAQDFLRLASLQAQNLPDFDRVTVYSPVPMPLQRIANVERAQMLVESRSRAALQRFLAAWRDVLHSTRKKPECKTVLRWAIDVDPLVV